MKLNFRKGKRNCHRKIGESNNIDPNLSQVYCMKELEFHKGSLFLESNHFVINSQLSLTEYQGVPRGPTGILQLYT